MSQKTATIASFREYPGSLVRENLWICEWKYQNFKRHGDKAVMVVITWTLCKQINQNHRLLSVVDFVTVTRNIYQSSVMWACHHLWIWPFWPAIEMKSQSLAKFAKSRVIPRTLNPRGFTSETSQSIGSNLQVTSFFLRHSHNRFVTTAYVTYKVKLDTLSALTLPVLCDGFPSQKPVMQNFDIFFLIRLNNLLNKRSSCRWLKTPWRPCGVTVISYLNGIEGVTEHEAGTAWNSNEMGFDKCSYHFSLG